ncbi:MAG TPA: methyl-accepting chemotaxis protein [Pseudorhodoplanes sp.]|jgi:methyl-accepting chemotaxis protein|nr:methyl-accepting chemotaxis protein [Pseudorhodoplanes sp.]
MAQTQGSPAGLGPRSPAPSARLLGKTSRLIASLSVRTRIAVIALIPIAGLIVNAIAFTRSEAEVETAFAAAHRAAKMAEASADYQSMLANIRILARDFSFQPTDEQVRDFANLRDQAFERLNTIDIQLRLAEANSQRAEAANALQTLRAGLENIASNFNKIIDEQRKLGFTEREGVRKRLRDGSNAVDSIINNDASWTEDNDARKLTTLLVMMRRYEAEYQISRMEFVQLAFFNKFAAFKESLARAEVDAAKKNELLRKATDYADGFADWIRGTDNVRPLLTIIDADTQQMMPTADRLIGHAREQAAKADAVLKASQSRTHWIVGLVGCAAVLIGLGLSWIIGRSITGPLKGLAGVMKQLAAGDTSARIPATRAHDEIGDMARSVIVFRDTMIERERLAEAQSQTSRARERRSEIIAATIARFEKSVGDVLNKVRAAAGQMESTSGKLDDAANVMAAEAHQAQRRVSTAAANVTTAAGSVEELAASISEISAQTHTATDVAQRAVAEARRTVRTMEGLSCAATRIGEVVSLIQSIAGQTNLLALNATIEAARAGEAGRGFAVVASEVKSLAAQTAKATQDIAEQIGSIQSATADATQAISQVNAIIGDMSAMAASVATTIEEQNSAVTSIADGVTTASTEARDGAEAMSRVAAATADARATAADVRSVADALAAEAEGLEGEVRRFLAEVQAA